MTQARTVLAVLFALALATLITHPCAAQQIHRNRFESREVSFIKGAADAPFHELIHETTDATARSGQYSEHLQLTSQQGSYIYYYYPTGKAPVTEELSVHLWLKANRPGIQLLARLVLPKERDPNDLQQPLTTTLRGDLYQEVSRWHRLELRRPANLAKQQQQIMRARLQRDVDFTDAYVDRIVLNVYPGPGLTEVWMDDLEIGPVVDATPFQTTSRPTNPVKLLPPGETPRPALPGTVVEMDRGHLLAKGRSFFFRGIRHSDTPLKTLRDAGFNTVWFDHSTPPALLDEAISLGFWLVPALPATENDPKLSSDQNLRQEIARFLERDGVLFWDVRGLTEEQNPVVSQTIKLIRSADPQRPIAADAWDGFGGYSRNLDLLGVHRWPLMTGLELPQYRIWLSQRRKLAKTGVFLWTWVQTHLPDWYTALVYEHSGQTGFDEPIGPQPEQIRLLTFTALSAGCRGVAFWSDRFLADSHQGRDRLLTMALLNQELKMLEPMLVTADEPDAEETSWIGTSDPDVKAAVLRTKFGLLVLPISIGKGSQFVPGQAARANLSLVIPQVPIGTQAWEVTPADIHCLKQERVIGGTRVTLPEFGLTAAIVFTADNSPNGIVVRFQEQARQTAKIAAQWAQQLSEEEIGKVTRVYDELIKLGHALPDGQKLLDDARRRSRLSAELFNRGGYREAYAEAQRSLRPLRILMRAEWEAATKSVQGLPVASPYAVSFYTLPRHWQFMAQVEQGQAGVNVLPNGDFELATDKIPEAWTLQETALDDVAMIARRVAEEPKEGRQCLKLEIKPKNAQAPVPQALERTYLAIHSPRVRVQPGSIVRISAWIRIPKPINATADGALFYDSIGDEPLAVRLNETKGWQKVTLYRRVPASGSIGVTMALTGLGVVYFDDVRVEPLSTTTTAARTAQP